MNEWQKVFDKNIRAYISLINEFLLKNEWQNVEVGSVLKKDTQKIRDAVLAKNYLKEGKFKIVSQSKDLFSGYSDDESLLNNLTKPVIIFGDHTQIVKYIDFPFVLGADGVKVLEPSDEYETMFFYYLLKAIDLNSNKYARHFSLLRKTKIPFKKNSLELQNLITSYLSDFEKNALSEETYFDFEIEGKIKNLHISNIKVGTLLDELSNQQTYLTQLRQAILQEAIEGKLTADWRVKNPVQRGNPDYDAQALLATIQAEKQKLMADGKIKKEKPLAPINPDDVPFALPDGWVWVRLGSICQIKGGKRVSNGYKLLKSPTPHIYIRVTDMKNGTIDDSDLHYLDEKMYELIKNYTISKNDLYMTIVGATIGKCGIVPDKFDNMNLTENAAKIIPYQINKIFLLKCLSGIFCQKQFLDKTKQVAVQKMALNRFETTLLPLPPLAEQNAIVERVDRLLESVNALEQQVIERKSYAEQLMQVVLKEAFTR